MLCCSAWAFFREEGRPHALSVGPANVTPESMVVHERYAFVA